MNPERDARNIAARHDDSSEASQHRTERGRPRTLPSNIPALERSSLTLPGAPERGTIHHLAWHHGARNGMDREELVLLGQRNAAILRQVGELKVSSVFIEGHDTSEGAESLVVPCELQQLAGYFPHKRVPHRISDYQALVLADVSIASATAFFYPEVSVHGADTHVDRIRNLSFQSKDETLRDAIVFHYREVLALEAIVRAFEGKAPEQRVAALIFGAAHVFNAVDIPHSVSPDQMPEVHKHEFEEWSLFHDTKNFQNASSAIERILSIRQARRLSMHIWSDALTSTEQSLILPKLKANPDFVDSADELRGRLLRSVADGPRKAEVLGAIEHLYETKSGPFSDITTRPRSGAALARVPGRYESLEICREKHPFTQLEMVRRASAIEWWAYSSIITDKGQLLALDKLQRNPGEPLDTFYGCLLRSTGSERVRKEVIRRHHEGIAPFAAIP